MTKHRTLEDYKRAGAYLRLLNSVFVDTFSNVCRVFPLKETGRLASIDKNVLVKFRCSAEERMWHDHPGLTPEHRHVFFGSPDVPPRDDVDLEVQGIIIDIMEEMLNKAKAARELALTRRQG